VLVTSNLTSVYSWLSAIVSLNMQAPPSTLSCTALAIRMFRSLPLMPITSQSSRRERAQLSQLSGGGGFSNSELRMPNTAESHEYPDRVTSQLTPAMPSWFSAVSIAKSKSSIKRAQIFFSLSFENHRGITLSLNALCFDKKLSYRRGTARCIVSTEILPIATQQCRDYLYDKS